MTELALIIIPLGLDVLALTRVEFEAAKERALAAGLVSHTLPPNGKPEAPAHSMDDRLLTPEKAAERLGMSVRWMYRHSNTLPFTRRLSRKALRFSEAGLRKWQSTRPR